MTKPSIRKRLLNVLAVCIVMTVSGQAQIFSSVFNFDGSNGIAPYSSLAQGADGRLYGTATEGGDYNCYTEQNGCGTIFGVSSEGKLTMSHALESNEGVTPYAGLLLGTSGSFYGTTVVGTIFTITRAGNLAVLDSLCPHYPNCPYGDGLNGLIRASDGNFYGTAYDGGGNLRNDCSPGGQSGCGTIFKMAPNGTVSTFYDFCSQNSCTDGSNPIANLVEGSDGYLYGVTTLGGTNCSPYGCGTVFKIGLDGTLVTLHSFNGNDGSSPIGALTQGPDGEFYGTTAYGGNMSCGALGGCGTIFKISPSGSFSTLYTFCLQTNCPDGSVPDMGVNGVALTTDGNFYGVTQAGGANNDGTVFRVTPSGKLTTMHSFSGPDGAAPWAAPIQATNGVLYGTTAYGGPDDPPCEGGCGTIYSLDMGLGPFVTFVQPFGKVGRTAQILGQGFNGTTNVSFNGVAAQFTVKANTFLIATVPYGATTGYVTVTTPTGVLKSNVPFHVIP